MRYLSVASAAIMMAIASAPSSAEPFAPVKPRISLQLAYKAAHEAMLACEAKHFWVSATVVDLDGIPQLQLRGDRATVQTGETSFRKAYTVVSLGPEFSFDRSSTFFNMVKTNPFAPQITSVHNILALPGAVAFKANGEIIGALGIGGAPRGDEDEACAAAGVEKVASMLAN